MKKIGKILLILFLIPYTIIGLFVTVCLVKYNKFNVTTFGDYSFIIVNEARFSGYKKGDLVVVLKNDLKDINVNDAIFYYNIKEDVNYIQYGVVKTKSSTSDATAYIMDNDYNLTSDYIIGKSSTSKVYHNFGSVLAVFESGLGYLTLVVVPVLLVLVKVARALRRELKENEE